MGRIEFYFFLLVPFIQFTEGSLSLTVTKDLTNDGFTFMCVLSPGPINTLVFFEIPSGGQIGGCAAPVNPTTSGTCSSTTNPSSTVTQDMSTSTTTIDIPGGYINVTSGLTGTWKCTHGSDEATVTYSDKLAFNTDGLSFTSPKTSADFESKSVTQVTFNMACLFPSATYNIDYLDSESGNAVLHTQPLASSSCTTTTASCTTADPNAFGQDCTFNIDESKLASRTIFRVTALVTGMQTTDYPTVVSSFTITKEPTTVHGSSTTYLDTTDTTEENSTTDIFKTSLEAETSTERNTQRKLNVDDDLVVIVMSSVVGGIILIIIIVFGLYFVVKRVRTFSKKKTSNTHTNEGTYNIGMVTESYSSNHNEGESRQGSKPQRMDDYKPKSLNASNSTQDVYTSNQRRDKDENESDRYVQSSSRMSPPSCYKTNEVV